MEPGLWIMGHRVSDFGWVGSDHGSAPVFDPVLSFNMCAYHGLFLAVRWSFIKSSTLLNSTLLTE